MYCNRRCHYLLKYLNNNVTVAFYICRHSSYCFLDNNNRSRGVLTASRTPGKAMHLGPYLTTHRNKTVNVYKIKHIDIVLVFPTKSVFKPQKNIQYTTCIDKHGATMPVVPGKCPACPCVQTVLNTHLSYISPMSMLKIYRPRWTQCDANTLHDPSGLVMVR